MVAAGSCLALVSIVAISVSSSRTFRSAGAVKPMNLFSFANSLRIRGMNDPGKLYAQGFQTVMPLGRSVQNLPYETPWLRSGSLAAPSTLRGKPARFGNLFKNNFDDIDGRQAQDTRSGYKMKERAEFYSTTRGGWIPCKVVAVDAKKGVQLDVKPNVWISAQEQKKSMRQTRRADGPMGWR